MSDNTITRYMLTATEGREYSADRGWELADHTYSNSERFETKELALAAKDSFIESLKVGANEVFDINLITQSWEDVELEDIDDNSPNSDDIENIDMIDNSDKLSDYTYVAYQYHGQYMIAQGKWRLDYTPNHYHTINELMKVCEYSSFQYHAKEVFKTKEDAIEYMKDKHVVSTVIEELMANED